MREAATGADTRSIETVEHIKESVASLCTASAERRAPPARSALPWQGRKGSPSQLTVPALAAPPQSPLAAPGAVMARMQERLQEVAALLQGLQAHVRNSGIVTLAECAEKVNGIIDELRGGHAGNGTSRANGNGNGSRSAQVEPPLHLILTALHLHQTPWL